MPRDSKTYFFKYQRKLDIFRLFARHQQIRELTYYFSKNVTCIYQEIEWKPGRLHFLFWDIQNVTFHNLEKLKKRILTNIQTIAIKGFKNIKAIGISFSRFASKLSISFRTVFPENVFRIHLFLCFQCNFVIMLLKLQYKFCEPQFLITFMNLI